MVCVSVMVDDSRLVDAGPSVLNIQAFENPSIYSIRKCHLLLGYFLC